MSSKPYIAIYEILSRMATKGNSSQPKETCNKIHCDQKSYFYIIQITDRQPPTGLCRTVAV